MEEATSKMAGVRQRWGRPRFGYRANAVMLWIGGWFLPGAYVLVWFAAGYFFVCAPKARRASAEYLERVQGGRRNFFRRCWGTYRHMLEFGLLLLDRALMLAKKEHRFNMVSAGKEHLLAALAEERGLLMLTAHFGNAEAAAPYLAKYGLTRPIHLVMYQDAADATERFHTAHRRLLSDARIISTKDPLAAGVRIMRALRDHEVVAIRADRALDGRTIEARLLGGTVRLPAGPFLAAALSDSPVVHVYTARVGYRDYRCVISEAKRYGDSMEGTRDERARRAAEDYAGFLETNLREHPRQWGNFYDFWGNC